MSIQLIPLLSTLWALVAIMDYWRGFLSVDAGFIGFSIMVAALIVRIPWRAAVADDAKEWKTASNRWQMASNKWETVAKGWREEAEKWRRLNVK